MNELVTEIVSRLGIGGLLIWAAVKLGLPLVNSHVQTEKTRGVALQAAVDALTAVLGELKAARKDSDDA